MADILNQIDETLADVTECFCGCTKQLKADGPSPWFVDEVCQSNWARRSVVRSSSEEEAAPVEAVVEAPALGERQFREAFAEIAATRQAQPLRPVRLAETWRCPHCDFSTFIGGLKRLHEVACPAPPVGELRPFFTTALDGEADAFAERISAALDELVEPEPGFEHFTAAGMVFHRSFGPDMTETRCDCEQRDMPPGQRAAFQDAVRRALARWLPGGTR